MHSNVSELLSKSSKVVHRADKGTRITGTCSSVLLMTRLAAANISALNNSQTNKHLSNTVKEHARVSNEVPDPHEPSVPIPSVEKEKNKPMVLTTNIYADCAAADVQSRHITSCSSIYANDTNQSSFAHSKGTHGLLFKSPWRNDKLRKLKPQITEVKGILIDK
nr:hypothetical protein [Tanacetum cinerariifolium]